jgi:hypothetical protein
MQRKIENTVSALLKNSNDPNETFDSKTLYAVGRENGMTCKEVKETFLNDSIRVGRGRYDVRLLNVGAAPAVSAARFPAAGTEAPQEFPVPVDMRTASEVNVRQKTFADVDEVFIPMVESKFVAWGEYDSIKTIIQSRAFFPTYISGLSGNGKTMMVEQACAKLKREYVRVQISPETDETDLIGGFRLIDGETVFYKGPVIKAMERGAILLIDELDRGSNKIMCLQGVLEGKPVLVKKIGQVIVPQPGFNVIATANTKGRGSEDGRFSSATIIDEAFIERFVATIDQPYPPHNVEKNIVTKHMEYSGYEDEGFAEKLVAWAQIIRKTFDDGAVEEVISTRRLCHIVLTNSIFKDRFKSIAMCIARFDAETRDAFNDLYTKIDTQENPTTLEEIAVEVDLDDTSVPF